MIRISLLSLFSFFLQYYPLSAFGGQDQSVGKAEKSQSPSVKQKSDLSDPQPNPTNSPGMSGRSGDCACFYMVTSYYGDGFHGGKTSNGERFDRNGMTAAHKGFPFGTLLQVSDPETGASVRVRVNDHGPYRRGRDLDLSEGAARLLGMTKVGVKMLLVQVVFIPPA